MLSPSLFLPYVLIALVVTAVAARRAKTPQRKRWITLGLLGFFGVFAFIDDILGGIQHKWLCEKEAGFWVYKPVNLPAGFYDASGTLRFMGPQGPDEKMLEPYLRFDWRIIRAYRQTFLKIDKRTYTVTDKRSGQTVAENITFMSWPSEFIPSLSHIGANRCFEGKEEDEKWRHWYSEVFAIK